MRGLLLFILYYSDSSVSYNWPRPRPYTPCCGLGDHSVKYEGPTEVVEGDTFQISCEMPARDPPLWTINTSQTILDENTPGYRLVSADEGAFRRKVILLVESTQLYQEGAYRCNRNSRDFHYVNVIPAFTDGKY